MSREVSDIQPTFFDTPQACRRLGISPTFLKECRQAKLIEYISIGEKRVRYTEEQLANFEAFIKSGGLQKINRLFVEMGIRKPPRKGRTKKKDS